VINSRILSISKIGLSQFISNRQWLPSAIKLTCSKSVYKNETTKSIEIENNSKLARIESKAFEQSNFHFIAIPSSVGFLGE
jgi:hypothetical protein